MSIDTDSPQFAVSVRPARRARRRPAPTSVDRSPTRFLELPLPARRFVIAVVVTGILAVAVTVAARPPSPEARAVLFVTLAVAAGLVKVPLPVVGTLSLGYAFVLATLMGFGLGASTLASLLSAVASGLVPCNRDRRPPMHRTCFNAGLCGLTASLAGLIYLGLGGPVGSVDPLRDILPILGYTVVFSVVNLALISLAIHLTGDDRVVPSLRANFTWAVPGYVAGGSLAILLNLLHAGEELALLALAVPFAYLVHLAYRARTQQVKAATDHSRQTADLYRAVTEALALAIEAKDENTEDHLNRVQQYCLGIAERLGLPEPEMEALRAAALLHDIGKIAVPEYILTKPGHLTPEEAEKMMIHPRVGAEILGAVPFPYPVAPIVRHHHERWDGNGYPDRLAGEAIPLGARILAVVDCYDALTSDRPYRAALSRNEAREYVRTEAGRMFDPVLVDLLLDHAEDLERRVGALVESPSSVPSNASRAADEPDARPDVTAHGSRPRVWEEISASKRELQSLYEIARTVGHQLDLEETLTLLAAKIRALIPYRALVVYLFDESRSNLVARFTTGDAADRLASLVIPVGEKLSGWAALHQKAYTGRAHLNPIDRDGSRSDLEDLAPDPELAQLRSALVAPLTTEREQLGVIALYHEGEYGNSSEHRRLLTTVAAHVAQAIRNTFLYGLARSFSLTDALTGVPNARFYFLEAGHRIVRAQDDAGGFGIMALRVANLPEVHEELGGRAAERMISLLARRLAGACRHGETLIRFGSHLFLCLTEENRPQNLIARSRVLAAGLEGDPVELRLGVSVRARVSSVQGSFPEDGRTPDELLDAIEVRLATPRPTSGEVVSFPSGHGRKVQGEDGF